MPWTVSAQDLQDTVDDAEETLGEGLDWYRATVSSSGWTQGGTTPTSIEDYTTALLAAPTSSVAHGDLVEWTFPVDGARYPTSGASSLLDDASADHRVYTVAPGLEVHLLAIGAQRAQGGPADNATAPHRFHTTVPDAAVVLDGSLATDGDSADVLTVCRINHEGDWYPCLGLGMRARLGHASLTGTGRVSLPDTSGTAELLPRFDPRAWQDRIYDHITYWPGSGPSWSSWSTSERLDAPGFSLLRTPFSESILAPPVWLEPDPDAFLDDADDAWEDRPGEETIAAFLDTVEAQAAVAAEAGRAAKGTLDDAFGATGEPDLDLWSVDEAQAVLEMFFDSLPHMDPPGEDVQDAWDYAISLLGSSASDPALLEAVEQILQDATPQSLTLLLQQLMPAAPAAGMPVPPDVMDLVHDYSQTDADDISDAPPPGELADAVWDLVGLYNLLGTTEAAVHSLIDAGQASGDAAVQEAFTRLAAAYASLGLLYMQALDAVEQAAADGAADGADAAALLTPLLAEADALAEALHALGDEPRAAALALWKAFVEGTMQHYMPSRVYDAGVPTVAMVQCEIVLFDTVLGTCREPLWRTGSTAGDFRTDKTVARLDACDSRLSPSSYNWYAWYMENYGATTSSLSWTGVPAWAAGCSAFDGTIEVPWTDIARPSTSGWSLEAELEKTLQGRLVARYGTPVFPRGWWSNAADALHHVMPQIGLDVVKVQVHDNGAWLEPGSVGDVFGGLTRVEARITEAWSTAGTDLPGMGAITILLTPHDLAATADDVVGLRQRAGPHPFSGATVLDTPAENLHGLSPGHASNLPLVTLGGVTAPFVGHGVGDALEACVREAWSHHVDGPTSNLDGAFALEPSDAATCTTLTGLIDLDWPVLPGPLVAEVRTGPTDATGTHLLLPTGPDLDDGTLTIDLSTLEGTLPWDPADPRHDEVLAALSHSHARRVVVVLPDTWSPETLSLAVVLLAEAWHDHVSAVAVEIEDLPLPRETAEALARLRALQTDGFPVPALLVPAGSTAAGIALPERLMGIWGLASHPDVITIGSGTVAAGVDDWSRLGPGPDLAPKPDFLAPGLGDTASAVAGALPVVESLLLSGFEGPVALRGALAAVAVPHADPTHTFLLQGHGVLDTALMVSDAGLALPSDLADRAAAQLTGLGGDAWAAIIDASTPEERIAGLALSPGRLDPLLSGTWPALTLDAPVLPLSPTVDHGTVGGAARDARLKLLDLDAVTAAALDAHRQRLDHWESLGLIDSPWDDAILATTPEADSVSIESTHFSVFGLMEADLIAGMQRVLTAASGTDAAVADALADWDLVTDQPAGHVLVHPFAGSVQGNATAHAWPCDGPADPGALLRYLDAVGSYLDKHRVHLGGLAMHGVVGDLDAAWFTDLVEGSATATALRETACNGAIRGAIEDILRHLDTLETATLEIETAYAGLDLDWTAASGAPGAATVRAELDKATTALGLPAVSDPSAAPVNTTLEDLRGSLDDVRALIDEWLTRLAPSQSVGVVQPRVALQTDPAALGDLATPLGPYVGITLVTTHDQSAINPLTGQPVVHPVTGAPVVRDVTTFLPALLWNTPDVTATLRHRDASAIEGQGLSLTGFQDAVFDSLQVTVDATSQGLEVPVAAALAGLVPDPGNFTQGLEETQDAYETGKAGVDPDVSARVAVGLDALLAAGSAAGLDSWLTLLYSHRDGVGARTDADGAAVLHDIFPTASSLRLQPTHASTTHALAEPLSAPAVAPELDDLDRQVHRDIRQTLVGDGDPASNTDKPRWRHLGHAPLDEDATRTLVHRAVEMHADPMGAFNQFGLAAATDVAPPELLTCLLVEGHNARLGTDFRSPLGCPDQPVVSWPDDAAALVCHGADADCAERLVSAVEGDPAACQTSYGDDCATLQEAARILYDEVQGLLLPQRTLPVPWLRGLDDAFVSNPLLQQIDRAALVAATMDANGVDEGTATAAVDALLTDMADGIHVDIDVTEPPRDRHLDLRPLVGIKGHGTDIVPGTDWCSSSADGTPPAGQSGSAVVAGLDAALAHLPNETRTWYDALRPDIEALAAVGTPRPAEDGIWSSCRADHGLHEWDAPDATMGNVSYDPAVPPHLSLDLAHARFDWSPDGLGAGEEEAQTITDVRSPAPEAAAAAHDRQLARLIAGAHDRDLSAQELAENLFWARTRDGWEIDHHRDAVRARTDAPAVAMLRTSVPLPPQAHLTATFAGEAYFENSDAFLVLTPDDRIIDALLAGQENVSAALAAPDAILPLARPEKVAQAMESVVAAAGLATMSDQLRIRHLNPSIRVAHDATLTQGDTLRQDDLLVKYGGLRVKDLTTTFEWVSLGEGDGAGHAALHALVVVFPLVDRDSQEGVLALVDDPAVAAETRTLLEERGAKFILSDTALQYSTYLGVPSGAAGASLAFDNPARPWIEETDLLWSQPAAKTPLATSLEGDAALAGTSWSTVAPAEATHFDMDCSDGHASGRWYTPRTFGTDGIGSQDPRVRTWSQDGRCVQTDALMLEPGTLRDMDGRSRTYDVPAKGWMAWRDYDLDLAGTAGYERHTHRLDGWGGAQRVGIWYAPMSGPAGVEVAPGLDETYGLMGRAVAAGLQGLAGWTGSGVLTDAIPEPSLVPYNTLNGRIANATHVWRVVERDDLLAAGAASLHLNDSFEATPVAAGVPWGDAAHAAGRMPIGQDFDPGRLVFAARLTTAVTSAAGDEGAWTLESQWGDGIAGRVSGVRATGAGSAYSWDYGIGAVTEATWYESQGGNASSPLGECLGFPAHDIASRHAQCYEGATMGSVAVGSLCASYLRDVTNEIRRTLVTNTFDDARDVPSLEPPTDLPREDDVRLMRERMLETAADLVPLECHPNVDHETRCVGPYQYQGYEPCMEAEAGFGHLKAAAVGLASVQVSTSMGSRIDAFAAAVTPQAEAGPTTDVTALWTVRPLDPAAVSGTLVQETRGGTTTSIDVTAATGTHTFQPATGSEVRYTLTVTDERGTVQRSTDWLLADPTPPRLELEGHDVTLLAGLVVGPGRNGTTIGSGDAWQTPLKVTTGHIGFPGTVSIMQDDGARYYTQDGDVTSFTLRTGDGRSAEPLVIRVVGKNGLVATHELDVLVPYATTGGGENKDAAEFPSEWDPTKTLPSGGPGQRNVEIPAYGQARWDHKVPSDLVIAEATFTTAGAADVFVVHDDGGDLLRITKSGSFLKATTRDGSQMLDPALRVGGQARDLRVVFSRGSADITLDGAFALSLDAPRQGAVTGMSFAAGPQPLTIDDVRLRTLVPALNVVQAESDLSAWSNLTGTTTATFAPTTLRAESPIDAGAATTAVARVRVTTMADGTILGLESDGETVGALELRDDDLYVVGATETLVGPWESDWHRIMLEVRGDSLRARVDDGEWVVVQAGGSGRPDLVYMEGPLGLEIRGLRFESSVLATDTYIDDASAGWDWTAARTTAEHLDTVGDRVLVASTKMGPSSITTPLPGVDYGIQARFRTPGSTSAVHLVSGVGDAGETWSVRVQKNPAGDMEMLYVSSASTKQSDPYTVPADAWQQLRLDVHEEEQTLTAWVDGNLLIDAAPIPSGTKSIVVGATSTAPATSLYIDDVSVLHRGWYAEDPQSLGALKMQTWEPPAAS